MAAPHVISSIVLAGELSCLSLHELLEYINQFDSETYLELYYVNSKEELTRDSVLSFLYENNNLLYDAISQVVNIKQTTELTYLQACEAIKRYYKFYNTVDVCARERGEPVEKKILKKAKEKKGVRRKQPREAELPEHTKDLESVLAFEVEEAAEMLTKKPKLNFFAVENFSLTDFDWRPFACCVKKGENKLEIKDVLNQKGWEVIYHVTSLWEAEELVENLQREGKRCFIAKRRRATGDQEIQAYKVVCG